MAEKIDIREVKSKLVKVNLAIEQLAENRSRSKGILSKLLQLREVKVNLLNLLKEAGETTAIVQSTKGNITTIPVHSEKELKALSTHKDVKAIEKLTGEKVKGSISEEKREYTAEESQAVGEELVRPLQAAIRSTKGELPTPPEVVGHVNKFTVHAVYGRDKGEDTFTFILNPEDSTLYLKSGNEKQVVAPFEVTQANQVNISPEINLEEVLKDLMTKYVSEPTDKDYDDMAAQQLPHDISQINKFIAERKSALRNAYLLKEIDSNIKDGTKIQNINSNATYTVDGKGEGTIYAKNSQGKRVTIDSKAFNAYKVLEEPVTEKLGPNTPVSTYVKDFEKSDAPQFKGKSKEKRAQMGVAAALQAKNKAMKEDLDIGHQDNEPHMLKADLYKLIKNAADLYKAMEALEGQGEVDFPQWWQGKIMRASDDVECAKEYLEFEMEEPAIDAAVATLGEESEVGQVDTKTLKNVKLKNGKIYTNVRFHLPNDPKSFVTTDGGYMISQDIQSVVNADQELKEIAFDIAGLGTYTSTKGDSETITGVDQGGTTRTFSRKKVELDNPGIFDRKPREKKPQGIRPYTESQYRNVLQGAIDDAGSTEFAYDIADSMIHDPQILARLKKDYPGESARELKQQLQWDLEACNSPEDDNEEDEENYDN